MLFVGERRSKKAETMGVTWRDGRLAAKQLFDALAACGIDPAEHDFINLFETGGQNLARCYRGQVVAMGDKVAEELRRLDIAHVQIVHPAARGRIRKKENYAAHVRTMLVKS